MSIIDASVYLAMNKSSEPGHKASMQWMRKMRATGEKIFAPNILVAEVCAAISHGTGDTSEAQTILHRLLHSRVVTLIPVTDSIAFRAADIGLEHKIRGCDAIYVAVAEQVGQTLITLDKEQLERGKAVVATARPEETLDNWEA